MSARVAATGAHARVEVGADSVASPRVATELDLRGVPCPLNWVRTRLALEQLPSGRELIVALDPGEPLDSVARSAREDGHDVALDGESVRIVRP